MDVLSGRHTVAEAAAQVGVTRQTIYNWRATFVAGGSARLAADRHPVEPAASAGAAASAAEPLVAAIVERLREHAAPDALDYGTLEAVRTGARLPVSRFCELIGMPRRSYYALRPGASPAPAVAARNRLDHELAVLRSLHPEWGARRLWRHLTATGRPGVSLATVKRSVARQILREARTLSS